MGYVMQLFFQIAIFWAIFSNSLQSFATRCGDCNKSHTCLTACQKITCCDHMGGISYCDSSANRYVCNNGYYSECYCTRHAVMELSHLQGCCLWQGGVLTTDETGLVICNNGGVSEVCALTVPTQSVSSW
jgi:hypothetical protein